MKEEVKIVARTKSGEVLKGFVKKDDVVKIETSKPVYLRFATPINTIGTMINQDQLQGVFLVKTFEGKKDPFPVRFFYDLKRIFRKNFPIIIGAVLMVSLSLVGLLALL